MQIEEMEQVKRKPNWGKEEILLLVQLVNSKKTVIKGKLGGSLTSKDKRDAWKSITEDINAAFTHVLRSSSDVEKKWYNVLSASRQEISKYKKTMTGTGGGPGAEKLSPIAEAVYDILGQHNVSISGIGEGMDSSILQMESEKEPRASCSWDVQSDPSVQFELDPSVQLDQYPVIQIESAPAVDRKRQLEIDILELQKEYYSLKIMKLKKEMNL